MCRAVYVACNKIRPFVSVSVCVCVRTRNAIASDDHINLTIKT